MENTLEQEERTLSDAILLSQHVRKLASALCKKTEATSFASDTLILANEVETLCDYVEQLQGKVETLLTTASSSTTHEVTAQDRKAVEIQREIHEFDPTINDTIKALFMWRDSPKQRLRDDR
jgi:Na+/phosphate symporter